MHHNSHVNEVEYLREAIRELRKQIRALQKRNLNVQVKIDAFNVVLDALETEHVFAADIRDNIQAHETCEDAEIVFGQLPEEDMADREIGGPYPNQD